MRVRYLSRSFQVQKRRSALLNTPTGRTELGAQRRSFAWSAVNDFGTSVEHLPVDHPDACLGPGVIGRGVPATIDGSHAVKFFERQAPPVCGRPVGFDTPAAFASELVKQR